MTASTQPRPTGQRNTAMPFIGAGVFLGAAALLGWSSWEASVPDPLAHQVFVCAYVAVAVFGAVCLLLRSQPRIPPGCGSGRADRSGCGHYALAALG